jgi:hypothetical protein
MGNCQETSGFSRTAVYSPPWNLLIVRLQGEDQYTARLFLTLLAARCLQGAWKYATACKSSKPPTLIAAFVIDHIQRKWLVFYHRLKVKKIFMTQFTNKLLPFFFHSSTVQLWTLTSIITPLPPLGSLICFITCGRSPWMSDQLVARAVLTQDNTT